MEYHDKFTSDGYEGAVIRDKDAKYKCGGRDRRMLKIKLMDSKTFKIIGYELGLRGVEDMCFIMETPDKQTFKAKPVGSLEIKQSYIKDMSKLINKPGDVQFFRYKEGGIPNLPIFLAPRLDLNDGSY